MCWAQSAGDADQLFTSGNYAAAQVIYKQLTHKYPTNTLYLYRYARCAQEMGDHMTAVEYFLRSGDRYVLKHFFLGESYMALWRNQEAVESYEKYLELAANQDRTKHIDEQITLAQKRLRYLRRVENIAVIGYEELSKSNFLDSYKLSNNAGILSQDTLGLVTFTLQRGDKCFFTIKSDSASLIATRFRLLNKWGNADTLPEVVNISTKQNYPYCLNDGITLYFASDHPSGMGGMDIYVTRYNTATETFTTPENLGFPFNSTGNDYMYAVDEEKGIGYFATDRFSSKDSVRVYSFSINDTRNYLHGLSTDTLAMYAQLMLYNKADSVNAKNEENTKIKDIQTIFFVLNDTTVYTSLDDFHNEEARQLYDEYTHLNARLTAISTQLNALRIQYAHEIEQDQKNNIKQNILTLEKEKKLIVKTIPQTLSKIRLIENTK